MARSHADDVQYRAVVRTTFPERVGFDGRIHPAWSRSEHIGPYLKQHTAAAQVTRISRSFGRSPGVVVTGHVEVGQVTWSPVAAPSEPTVTIPASTFEALKDDSRFLSALRAAGVDNWEGYSFAFDDDDDEDDDDDA